jgi:RNA polymerase sigma factor (TIGR02999 family)
MDARARMPGQRGRQVSHITFAEIARPTEAGAPQARDQLFVSLYDALRQMARRELRRGAGASLTPTTLLHETYLNLSQRESLAFSDRGQFMAYAARAMRGLIVDYLRSRHAQKRGGNFCITSLPTELPHAPEEPHGQTLRIDDLNDALESLEKIDTRLAQCVDLKFFCGLSFIEIAELREVSERTVQRDWDKARLLLKRIIAEREADCPAPT